MKVKKDLYKNLTIIIITVIIVFALSAFYFKYYPQMQKANEVKEYKKGLYESVLCQYSCPLEPMFVAQLNRTELMPSAGCVENCTLPFKVKDFSDVDTKVLIKDPLIVDVQQVIQDCKAASAITVIITNLSEPVTPRINTTMFFDCSSKGLTSLKENYTYLD